MPQVGNLARYVRRVAESADEPQDAALETRLADLEARVEALETAP
jgi:hypothetical protein